jgi:adenosylcobinamide-GDP ribazoletransferase
MIVQTFLSVLGFLSIIPVGRGRMLEPAEFGRFPAFYPAVGVVFGLFLYLAWLAGNGSLPPGLMAILLTMILVILNRGFHIDGLADAADALFSHKSREEKLVIMKDSRQGTFGVLAIVLDIMLKFQLVLVVVPQAPTALLLWPVWGRAAASVVAVRSDYVRSEGGLGKHMVDGSTSKELFYAALFGLALSLFFGGAALLTMLAALFFGFFMTWVWRKTLGGVTGDLLGATIELCEIFSLLVFFMLAG